MPVTTIKQLLVTAAAVTHALDQAARESAQHAATAAPAAPPKR